MSGKKQPNFLFIMDDQHRFDYLGCAGADFVNTPNIDRLAEMGMRFTNCFTNAPVCAPARIALATGLQAASLGSLDNQSFLPRSRTTYYQRLRDAGYRVGAIGKFDLAKPLAYNGRNGDRPFNYTCGFTHPEECEGKMHAGAIAEPQGPYGFYLQEKGVFKKFHEDYMLRKSKGYNIGAAHDSVLAAEDFEDAYIGRQSVRWIRDIPDDFPFHLFVSFVGPHDPFDPPTCYADKYREAEMPDRIVDSGEGKPSWIRERMKIGYDEAAYLETRRQYCASIEAIDDQIGDILDALEERGMLDETYIIFTSDHGEMLGDHQLFTKNVPYEGSIHVPLMIAGPGIARGEVSDAIIELIDCNATVCDLAGLPPQEDIDAVSFEPVLKGATEHHRENAVSRLQNFRCIRTKKYKYIENMNEISELYDLENDPNELTNIASDNPDICKELRQRLHFRYKEGEFNR